MVSESSDSRSSSSSVASPEMAEAAEALADLAHLAMREGSGADSGGDYGRRENKRVKSESPPPRVVAESATRCSELPQVREFVVSVVFLLSLLYSVLKEKKVGF